MEGAECEANYCGGCNAVWFLNGDDVTERCQEGECEEGEWDRGECSVREEGNGGKARSVRGSGDGGKGEGEERGVDLKEKGVDQWKEGRRRGRGGGG